MADDDYRSYQIKQIGDTTIVRRNDGWYALISVIFGLVGLLLMLPFALWKKGTPAYRVAGVGVAGLTALVAVVVWRALPHETPAADLPPTASDSGGAWHAPASGYYEPDPKPFGVVGVRPDPVAPTASTPTTAAATVASSAAITTPGTTLATPTTVAAGASTSAAAATAVPSAKGTSAAADGDTTPDEDANTDLAGKPFACAGKHYCSQMESCEEATFYFEHCGLGRLDGDKDGIPCEKLCR